jgi:hypothetical protein
MKIKDMSRMLCGSICCTVGDGVGPIVASVGLELAGLKLGATDVGTYAIMRMCMAATHT